MFGGFGWIRLGLYEYVKIQLRYVYRHEYTEASTIQVRISGNSLQFLLFCEIFFLKLAIKCHLPLLGHYSQIKCSSESCCCIRSTFEVSVPIDGSTKKTMGNYF